MCVCFMMRQCLCKTHCDRGVCARACARETVSVCTLTSFAWFVEKAKGCIEGE